MKRCKTPGCMSTSIRPSTDGRGIDLPDLCDKCYWKETWRLDRAITVERLEQVIDQRDRLAELLDEARKHVPLIGTDLDSRIDAALAERDKPEAGKGEG